MCVWGGCTEVDAQLQKRQSAKSGSPERSMGGDKSLLPKCDLHGGKWEDLAFLNAC